MTLLKTFGLAAGLGIAGVLYYLYGGHEAPAGQHALTDLTTANFDGFKQAFNAASGEVRVVLMFSPT